MVQSIQVLRFHLLELEKVSFLFFVFHETSVVVVAFNIFMIIFLTVQTRIVSKIL